MPKSHTDTSIEVGGSRRLINEALEGPIFDRPIKNVVMATTVQITEITATQNQPIKVKFRCNAPLNSPVNPKLSEAAPMI